VGFDAEMLANGELANGELLPPLPRTHHPTVANPTTASLNNRMESKTSHRRLNRSERRRRAWELRLTGMSQTAIARTLGCDQTTVSQDLRDCFEVYKKECDAEAVHFAMLTLARLEALLCANWSRAIEGDSKAGALCIKLLEREAKLLGLDAAKKVEVNGSEEMSLEEAKSRLAAILGVKVDDAVDQPRFLE
jgi:predicted transcriptional regulator